MVEYKCFMCNKKIPDNYLRKRIHCPYCGSKIIYKPRVTITTHLAR
ncbi:DNA-directed RNA polymerase subunit P [Candidatus Woesearchaeota archaeon]|nr:DNA-directed RNA polymerase subunit P [Candidatus Woesearchaeota archaeon]